MSLKAFHIFFIAVSALTALGFGFWSLMMFLAEAASSYLLMGLSSLACCVALVFYGIKFLQKLKNIGYL